MNGAETAEQGVEETQGEPKRKARTGRKHRGAGKALKASKKDKKAIRKAKDEKPFAITVGKLNGKRYLHTTQEFETADELSDELRALLNKIDYESGYREVQVSFRKLKGEDAE